MLKAILTSNQHLRRVAIYKLLKQGGHKPILSRAILKGLFECPQCNSTFGYVGNGNVPLWKKIGPRRSRTHPGKEGEWVMDPDTCKQVLMNNVLC